MRTAVVTHPAQPDTELLEIVLEPPPADPADAYAPPTPDLEGFWGGGGTLFPERLDKHPDFWPETAQEIDYVITRIGCACAVAHTREADGHGGEWQAWAPRQEAAYYEFWYYDAVYQFAKRHLSPGTPRRPIPPLSMGLGLRERPARIEIGEGEAERRAVAWAEDHLLPNVRAGETLDRHTLPGLLQRAGLFRPDRPDASGVRLVTNGRVLLEKTGKDHLEELTWASVRPAGEECYIRVGRYFFPASPPRPVLAFVASGAKTAAEEDAGGEKKENAEEGQDHD